MRMTVMIGISGSGKTTWANRIKTEDTIIVSADLIRQEYYGDDRIQGDGKLVFDMLFERIRLCLSAGYNVIVDNTSVTVEARKYLLNIAKEYNAETIAILVECSVEQALENQKGRKRQVPESVIRHQYERLWKSKWSLEEEFWLVMKV